jgi:hypothetical protein
MNGAVAMSQDPDGPETLEALRTAVELACQPTYVPRIESGRQRILAMRRDWVVEHIVAVGKSALNLDDYWEYRRLLEILDLLCAEAAVGEVIALGIGHFDPDVREAAEEWRQGRPACDQAKRDR